MKITTNGVKLNINISGNSNKTIILFSGWLHNFENEDMFIRKLSKYYKVITFTYPGYYGSDNLNKLPYRYKFADIVYGLVKKLKIKNYTLLGFSMGCQVVLSLVEKYKLKNKVILISPTTNNLESQIPIFLKPFIKNRQIMNIIRNNNFLANKIINLAYRKIKTVTENGRETNTNFKNEKITTKGAFDTLYFLVTNFIDPVKYKSQTLFIFGGKEILQKKLKCSYKTIINMGHGELNKFNNDIINNIVGNKYIIYNSKKTK